MPRTIYPEKAPCFIVSYQLGMHKIPRALSGSPNFRQQEYSELFTGHGLLWQRWFTKRYFQ